MKVCLISELIYAIFHLRTLPLYTSLTSQQLSSLLIQSEYDLITSQ